MSYGAQIEQIPQHGTLHAAN